ncbi:MAG: hypothetical protein ACQSGP_09515 [Frankia sp.]
MAASLNAHVGRHGPEAGMWAISAVSAYFDRVRVRLRSDARVGRVSARQVTP